MRCVCRMEISLFRNPHGQQGQDDGKETDPVQKKADPLARECDHDPCDGRSDEPRPVEKKGVQRNGVSQILFPVEHLDDERLPNGYVHRINEPEEQTQGDDVPDLYDSGEREEGQEKSLNHGQGLGRDQQVVTVQPVRVDAGDGREDKRRDLAREADQPQQEGRIRQAVDKPAHRDLLHPGADEGNRLAAEEKAEVPVLQGPQDGGDLLAPADVCHFLPERGLPSPAGPPSIASANRAFPVPDRSGG